MDFFIAFQTKALDANSRTLLVRADPRQHFFLSALRVTLERIRAAAIAVGFIWTTLRCKAVHGERIGL